MNVDLEIASTKPEQVKAIREIIEALLERGNSQ